MPFVFVVTREIQDELIGFFVNAQTGELVPVQNRFFNVTKETILNQGRVAIIKGPQARPIIAKIPAEIWKAENQPVPRAAKLEPYAPAKARIKTKAKQTMIATATSLPAPLPIQPTFPQPQFVQQLVGSPKAFVIFNECEKSER
jgi:hypothetical protein